MAEMSQCSQEHTSMDKKEEREAKEERKGGEDGSGRAETAEHEFQKKMRSIKA